MFSFSAAVLVLLLVAMGFFLPRSSAKLWNYPTADFKFPRVSFSSDGEWRPVTADNKHLCTDQVQYCNLSLSLSLSLSLHFAL